MSWINFHTILLLISIKMLLFIIEKISFMLLNINLSFFKPLFYQFKSFFLFWVWAKSKNDDMMSIRKGFFLFSYDKYQIMSVTNARTVMVWKVR